MFNSIYPLGLNKGSVRALIALTMTGGYLTGRVSEDLFKLVLGAYFVVRVAERSSG